MNTITKNQAFSPVNRYWFDDLFTREIGRLFEPSTSGVTSVPASANVWEDDKNLFMEFSMPGIKKEDVKVTVENNVLTVNAGASVKTEDSKKDFIRKEFHANAYTRSFRISEKRYQVNSIEAKLENGVLNLTIPKVVEEKKETSHTVEIK